MPLHVLPILKALAPLVANAGAIVAGLRAESAMKVDDRVAKLEQDTLRAGEVLKGLAEQLQAIALELRAQAEQTAALRRQTQIALFAAGLAFAGGVGAMIVGLSP